MNIVIKKEPNKMNRNKDVKVHILYDDEMTALVNSNGTGVKEKNCLNISLKYEHANILSKRLNHVLNETR